MILKIKQAISSSEIDAELQFWEANIAHNLTARKSVQLFKKKHGFHFKHM
jgi:hypothetical protein